MALVLLVAYGVQWWRYRAADDHRGEPTGKVLAELDPGDRIPLQHGAAADCNVLVITMDTTRADHIGCYGNRGVRTPVIDGLALSGVLFANAFTASSSTLPGHSSIFTGLYPYHHGARANGTFKLKPEKTTLAEILKENGYQTAAFISSYVLAGRFGLDQGFDLYDDDLTKGIKYSDHSFRERPAELTNESFAAWLETAGSGKFFAWIHYFDVHAPYVPPEPFRSQYADKLYDGEIAYVDFHIGRLLKRLGQAGVMENTLIVLAGDHGEGLGEHGEETHSLLVYDSTMHTPLIFKMPERVAADQGLVVHRQVSNADVAPTILDLLGIDSGVPFDGTSLLRDPEAHDDTIYGETVSTLVLHGWSPLFSVRRQEWKYIHAPRPELYNLKNDPKEVTNLLESDPSKDHLARGRDLKAVLDKHVGDDHLGAQALTQMVAMDAETKEKLAALGYVGAVGKTGVDAQKAAAFDPKDMVPHWERVQRASGIMAAGRFREGLEELEACLKEVPDDVWTMRLIATAYQEMGDWKRALEMARSVFEHEPNEPSTYLHLGRIALALGDREQAKSHYDQALNLDPRFAPTYLALGWYHARIGQAEKALQFFHQAIEIDPGSTGPGAYNSIGSMHLGRMEFDQAREAFEKALEIDRLNGTARAGLAEILLAEDKLAEAEERLAIAVRFIPNDPHVLATLAALHNKKEEHQEAITLARRALDVRAEDAQALNSLGSALRSTGDLAGAREAFEKVLTRRPNYLPCIINLAQVCLSERREEKAAELFRRALQVNPSQPMALFNLGTFEVSRGRQEVALRYYRRAVQADPEYALAHCHLGMLLLERGMAEKALPHLERSLLLDPDLQDRERVREVVERLRARFGGSALSARDPVGLPPDWNSSE